MKLKLGAPVNADDLSSSDFDEVVIATGVTPRTPEIDGIDHPSVVGYVAAIRGAPIGKKVAVIGAGGIGFDVSELLVHGGVATSLDREAFLREWGIDSTMQSRGGVT